MKNHFLGKRILELIENNEIKISSHGYDELAEDNILFKEVLVNVKDATVLEYYPRFPKGPCLLTLQKDNQNRPIPPPSGAGM